MKSKTLVAAAVAGLVWSVGASANQPMAGAQYHSETQSMAGAYFPSNANEVLPALTTITSLDTKTGGYKGWGPMANPPLAFSPNESGEVSFTEEMREQQRQLAEVKQVRDQVWVANAPLRSEYENIGATRDQAGGFGGFFSRGSK